MIHHFMLLDREFDEEALESLRDDPNTLHIHDDVLGPLLDTLAFIPTYDPCRHEQRHGLVYYGVTLIRSEGAVVAERVFGAWADLYAAAPPHFTLTGRAFEPPEEPEEGEDEACRSYGIGVGAAHWHITDERGAGFMRLEIDRDPLVAVLRRLAEWSVQVAADDRLSLLHWGI